VRDPSGNLLRIDRLPGSHLGERLAAPIAEFLDPRVDQL